MANYDNFSKDVFSSNNTIEKLFILDLGIYIHDISLFGSNYFLQSAVFTSFYSPMIHYYRVLNDGNFYKDYHSWYNLFLIDTIYRADHKSFKNMYSWLSNFRDTDYGVNYFVFDRLDQHLGRFIYLDNLNINSFSNFRLIFFNFKLKNILYFTLLKYIKNFNLKYIKLKGL